MNKACKGVGTGGIHVIVQYTVRWMFRTDWRVSLLRKLSQQLSSSVVCGVRERSTKEEPSRHSLLITLRLSIFEHDIPPGSYCSPSVNAL